MTRILATALLVAGLGTGATAQGIQPVTETPTDVTVGTQNLDMSLIVPLLAAGFAIIALNGDSSDGTR